MGITVRHNKHTVYDQKIRLGSICTWTPDDGLLDRNMSCYPWPTATIKILCLTVIPMYLRHGLIEKWRVRHFFYCSVHSFAAVMRLRSRCLAKIWRIHFTEPLPYNCQVDTHTNKRTVVRDLWSTPLRWTRLPWYAYQVTWRLVQAFRIW
jgi:hypothetical protein